jgi:hypothetical protein
LTELLAEPIRNAASVALLRVANRLLSGFAGQAVSTSIVMAADVDDSWFLTEVWQVGEREVDDFVARGEVTVFDDVDAFLASLDGIARAE